MAEDKMSVLVHAVNDAPPEWVGDTINAIVLELKNEGTTNEVAVAIDTREGHVLGRVMLGAPDLRKTDEAQYRDFLKDSRADIMRLLECRNPDRLLLVYGIRMPTFKGHDRLDEFIEEVSGGVAESNEEWLRLDRYVVIEEQAARWSRMFLIQMEQVEQEFEVDVWELPLGKMGCRPSPFRDLMHGLEIAMN